MSENTYTTKKHLLNTFTNDILNISDSVKNYMLDDTFISTKLFCEESPTKTTIYISMFLTLITKFIFLVFGYKLIKFIFYNFDDNVYNEVNLNKNYSNEDNEHDEDNEDNENPEINNDDYEDDIEKYYVIIKTDNKNLKNFFLVIFKIISIYILVKWLQLSLLLFNIQIN